MDPKEQKNLTVFSYGLAVIFCIFTFFYIRKNGWGISASLLLVWDVMFILITVILPTWLKPLYRRWMRVAHFISFLVTTVCLSFIFYFVFTPIGILLRLFKKDFLDRSIDRTVPSYWSKCGAPVEDIKRYTQQF